VKGGKKSKKVGLTELPVAKEARAFTGKFNKLSATIDRDEEIPGGFQSELFKKIGDAGIAARIITDAEGKTVTEIRVFQVAPKKPK